MTKESTLTVKTISTNIFRHVNNYIIERHGKRKMLLLLVFKVLRKNKLKRRKLKFSRLLHDIRRNSFLTEAANRGVL